MDIQSHHGCGVNGSEAPREPAVHQNGSDALPEPLPHQDGSVVSREGPACTADELVALLTRRGLAGWAFLVRDVAAGRVRRLHLRQLPAEQDIREALVTYLHRAGTALTISRIFLSHQQRSRTK